jgi:hypothetical protein
MTFNHSINVREEAMKRLVMAMMFLVMLCLGNAGLDTAKARPGDSHTMQGYLVDKMCGVKMAKLDEAKATEKAMKHSKDCALEDMCSEGGYGILSDGKFIKFDDNGDKLAAAYFNKSAKEQNFLVDVEGTMAGDVFKVKNIKDVVMQEKKSDMGGAQTVSGYLVDVACGTRMSKLDATKATDKAMNHSKDCALQDGCKASGYGILSDGKLTKFDENGNKLAAEYFNKTKKEKGFLVDVKGTMDGGTMKVESIKDAKMGGKKMGMKKTEKQG